MELAKDPRHGGASINHHYPQTPPTAQMFGLVYTGPANHFWHQLIAFVFRNHKEAGTILRKVC